MDGSWADIDVQLKRRYDLIPESGRDREGIREPREGHPRVGDQRPQPGHERLWAGGSRPGGEHAHRCALKSLFALSEAYPDLQAAGGFRDLQGQLSEIEETLSQARRYYNAVVRDYNVKTKSIPTNIVANMGGFRESEFFETDEGEREAPKVDFGS